MDIGAWRATVLESDMTEQLSTEISDDFFFSTSKWGYSLLALMYGVMPMAMMLKLDRLEPVMELMKPSRL